MSKRECFPFRGEIAMNKAKEIFKKVWISHFGNSKQLDSDLDVVLKHDYIFEAMQQYADEVSRESRKEILIELISIKEYMEERNAFHGYGQMNDLITKLQDEWLKELEEQL